MEPPTVLYIRTPPPELALHPQVIQATKAVLGETEETLRRLASELAAARGYLSDDGRKAILSRVLGSDQEKINRFSILLDFAEQFGQKRSGPSEILTYLEKWLKGPDNQKAGGFTQDDVDRVKALLPIILGPYPARYRQLKAESLAIATGLRADSVDLICDIRPIFDDDRRAVEGVMPFTTLKIVATGVDRFPVSFEAVLSAGDVQDLLKKVEAAVAKLNALGRLAEQANLPVPSVALTETRE